MQISIIGAGNMAAGIATRALVGGHRVRLTDRDPAKAKALAGDLRERVLGAGVDRSALATARPAACPRSPTAVTA